MFSNVDPATTVRRVLPQTTEYVLAQRFYMCRIYTHLMAEEKKRVDFNAPASLVEEADVVAELLGVSRTDLLVEGLRERLEDVHSEDWFQRALRDAYYDGRVDFETVETVVGTEEATRMRLLRASLDREPPVPDASEVDVPDAEAFYDGEVPTWDTDDGSDDT